MFLLQLFAKMTKLKHLNNLLDLNLFIRDPRPQSFSMWSTDFCNFNSAPSKSGLLPETPSFHTQLMNCTVNGLNEYINAP